MPTVPTIPPADRCFARLETFQCACPSCGRVLTSDQDQGYLSKRMLAGRSHPKRKPGRPSIKSAVQLTWNPYTQRLRCPWCRACFVAGLILFPMGNSNAGGTLDAPPDTVVTRSERMQLRALAGGWCTEADYRNGAPVNQVVTPAAPEPGL